MILEAIVTTLGPDDSLNVAPMGPEVEDGELRRFVLKPYKSATTYRNLKASGEGVLHVTDDVLLLARSAVGRPSDVPTRPAETVRGRILADCCRFAEFRVTELDDREDRTTIRCEAVALGKVREFFGWNRAKHAVLEAAILATRTGFLSQDDILREYDRLAVPVQKTGGPAEREAFAFLLDYVRSRRAD